MLDIASAKQTLLSTPSHGFIKQNPQLCSKTKYLTDSSVESRKIKRTTHPMVSWDQLGR